jgi:mono/diheme cytochrome c family protein
MKSLKMLAPTAALLLALGACSPATSEDAAPQPAAPAASATAAPQTATAAAGDQVARGQYLVTIAACNDCHTPFKMGPQGPEPDMERMLSGHPDHLQITVPAAMGEGPWMMAGDTTNTAFSGPWGVSFAANLTPDENTGMGIWTEEQFVGALRTGKHWGQSRPILPPMPWPAYGQMTDEDLAAVFAYLRTIPPIVNRVPEPLPPAAAPGGAPAG